VVAWLLSQILQMGLAGAVTGSGLAGLRPRTLFLRVIALVLSLAVVAIIIQNVVG
jgi:hypothetical protein